MPWKRVALSAFGLLFIAWLAGVALQTFDSEGVARRSATAAAPAATFTPSTLGRIPVSAVTFVPVATLSPTRAPTPRPTVDSRIKGGTEARIATRGISQIHMTVDREARDEWRSHALANDQAAQRMMVANGIAVAVADGTRILVLEHEGTSTRVRVLEGPHADKIGWVGYEFIR